MCVARLAGACLHLWDSAQADLAMRSRVLTDLAALEQAATGPLVLGRTTWRLDVGTGRQRSMPASWPLTLLQDCITTSGARRLTAYPYTEGKLPKRGWGKHGMAGPLRVLLAPVEMRTGDERIIRHHPPRRRLTPSGAVCG